MGKLNFIRITNAKNNIKLPADTTPESVRAQCIIKNTKEAYINGINSIKEYEEAVKCGILQHRWCYSKNDTINRCLPKLPLSEDVLYKLQLAWSGVF